MDNQYTPCTCNLEDRHPDPQPALGGARENLTQKISTALVPYELIMNAAIGLEYGREKYGTHNYQKGLPLTSLTESIKRHIWALERGELIDAESGLPHISLACSSMAMLAYCTEHYVLPFEPFLHGTVAGLARAGQQTLNMKVARDAPKS